MRKREGSLSRGGGGGGLGDYLVEETVCSKYIAGVYILK